MYPNRAGLRCGMNDTIDPLTGANNEPPALNSLYQQIQSLAGNGSNSLGDISTFLLNAGLGVEAARNALNIVASNVGSNPQQLSAINAELNYINSGGYVQSNKSTIVVLSLGAFLLWLAFRDNK